MKFVPALFPPHHRHRPSRRRLGRLALYGPPEYSTHVPLGRRAKCRPIPPTSRRATSSRYQRRPCQPPAPCRPKHQGSPRPAPTHRRLCWVPSLDRPHQTPHRRRSRRRRGSCVTLDCASLPAERRTHLKSAHRILPALRGQAHCAIPPKSRQILVLRAMAPVSPIHAPAHRGHPPAGRPARHPAA